MIIVIYTIIILLFIEILNRYRFYKFRVLLTLSQKTNKCNFYREYFNNEVNNYSIFMKKHIINDKFYQIFKSYYPKTTMTKIRIKNVLRKYIYDLDPMDNISLTFVPVERTINQLTKKFEQIYIVNQINSKYESDKNDNILNWSDLSSYLCYCNSLSIIIDHIEYVKFIFWMKQNDYHFIDITSDTRIWLHKIYVNSQINLFFLNNVSEILNINDTKINQTNIYVEIKGFTNYCALFDMFTLNIFNNFLDIDNIVRQMNPLFNMFNSTTKINIHLNNENTILIPSLIDYYHEKICNVFATNPIFFPYSYQTFFCCIKKGYHCDIMKKQNLIFLFNKLSLFDVYFNREISDKNVNILYSNKINVSFNEDCVKYVDKDNLTILLELFSKINIIL